MKMFKMFINIIKLFPLHIVTEIGSGRVTGSPGQLLPGRVGSRVNSFDPVPALPSSLRPENISSIRNLAQTPVTISNGESLSARRSVPLSW